MSKHLDTVKRFLEEQNVDYEVMHHEQVFTAQEIAGSLHVPGKNMVKSVIVTDGNQFVMCVLPAVHLIDFERLESETGHHNLRLASEEDLAQLYPDCEVGAEPPFGNWGNTHIELYADEMLREDNEIVFNAGTHTDAIKMRWSDYQRLTQPKLIALGVHV